MFKILSTTLVWKLTILQYAKLIKSWTISGDTYEEGGGGDSSYHSGKHDRESGRYGSDGHELHGVEDEEQAGKNHKHYHADKHESFHKSGGESAHGAKYEEASNRHKGNYKKVLRKLNARVFLLLIFLGLQGQVSQRWADAPQQLFQQRREDRELWDLREEERQVR